MRSSFFTFATLVLFFTINLFSQSVKLTHFPAHLQLYPRDNSDSAMVLISGYVQEEGHQIIALNVYQNDQLRQQEQMNLSYENGKAAFSFNPKIAAGLFEYQFDLLLDDVLIAREDSITCGDVYLINGQSNSHPNAQNYDFRSEFCRSFGKHTNYDDYDPADTTWGLSTPRGWCNDCYFAVGTWGLRLQQLILEKYGMPTCIINGGSGGSTISYNLPDSADHMNLTTTYGRLLYRATKAHVQNAVKAIFWHQGESDTYSPDAEAYLSRFTTLHDAWLQDYAPVDRIYVFQLHPGSCGGDHQSYLREVQRNFKQTFPKVHVMSTCGLDGHDGCHYNDDGYFEMAQWIFRLLERDFYNATDTLNIEAPDIRQVYYQDANHTSIAIDYDQPVIWPEDTLNARMEDYFYLDDESGFVKNGYTTNGGYTVILQLTAQHEADSLTYLPNNSYNRVPTKIYEGPWIRNERGVGALSFYHVPIQAGPSSVEKFGIAPVRLYLKTFPNPSNGGVVIKLKVAVPQRLTISVFDVTGKKVARIVRKKLNAGSYTYHWNGKSISGTDLVSGQYFIRVIGESVKLTKKVMLVK